MMYLKNDGSLDVERINQLSSNGRMKIVCEMTDAQYDYYRNSLPINEGQYHSVPEYVDSTIEDEIKRGCVDIREYLQQKRKQYGI